jgi:hypothetical protein
MSFLSGGFLKVFLMKKEFRMLSLENPRRGFHMIAYGAPDSTMKKE